MKPLFKLTEQGRKHFRIDWLLPPEGEGERTLAGFLLWARQYGVSYHVVQAREPGRATPFKDRVQLFANERVLWPGKRGLFYPLPELRPWRGPDEAFPFRLFEHAGTLAERGLAGLPETFFNGLSYDQPIFLVESSTYRPGVFVLTKRDWLGRVRPLTSLYQLGIEVVEV